MKAVRISMLAGVLWSFALAALPVRAESTWEQAAHPVASDPWFGTPGACGCDPCRSPGLWAGYCAERAAHYAHWHHFWQKVHGAITLRWLPKPHAGCSTCCPQTVPAEALPASEQPAAELGEPAEPQMPLPPPPQREARKLRLPLRAAVAAQAQQPVLRGRRGSWVRASLGEEKETSLLRLRWPKFPWPAWLNKSQAN